MGDAALKNRVVGHADVDPASLVPNDKNWRLHGEGQVALLRAAIGDVGFIRSVTVNKTTGRLVDGHARVMIAVAEGWPSIPVEYVELTEEEEAKALATIDPLSAMADTDGDKLGELLSGMNASSAELQSMLDRMREDAVILSVGEMIVEGDGGTAGGDEEPAVEAPPADEFKKFSLMLSPAQELRVRRAAKIAKDKFGVSTTADAVASIVDDWLARQEAA